MAGNDDGAVLGPQEENPGPDTFSHRETEFYFKESVTTFGPAPTKPASPSQEKEDNGKSKDVNHGTEAPGTIPTASSSDTHQPEEEAPCSTEEGPAIPAAKPQLPPIPTPPPTIVSQDQPPKDQSLIVETPVTPDSPAGMSRPQKEKVEGYDEVAVPDEIVRTKEASNGNNVAPLLAIAVALVAALAIVLLGSTFLRSCKKTSDREERSEYVAPPKEKTPSAAKRGLPAITSTIHAVKAVGSNLAVEFDGLIVVFAGSQEFARKMADGKVSTVYFRNGRIMEVCSGNVEQPDEDNCLRAVVATKRILKDCSLALVIEGATFIFNPVSKEAFGRIAEGRTNIIVYDNDGNVLNINP